MAHPSDHVDGGGVACLQDQDQNPALPILAGNVGLRRKAVADGGNIVQINSGLADLLDRQIVQRGDCSAELALRRMSYSS